MTDPQDFNKLLVTVEEAARRLSIGRSHLYEHLLRGTLRSVRIGRSRRIPSRDLESFIEALLKDSAASPPIPDPPTRTRPVKSIPEQPRRR